MKQPPQPPKKVKTTIDIPEELWRKFSIKVIEEYGGRKKNDVIENLIEEWVEEEANKLVNEEGERS